MQEVLSADVIRLINAMEDVWAASNATPYVTFVTPRTYDRLQHTRAMGLAYERKRAKRKLTFRQRLERIARHSKRHGGQGR